MRTEVTHGGDGMFEREQDGQAVIIVVVAMIGLMGFLGLVTDVGWSFYQKRVAQNAADAVVLAAIQEIANSHTDGAACNSGTLSGAVSNLGATYTAHNTANGTVAITYIDNSGATVASGSACSATGIRAAVTSSYNNFFLSVIGIGSATVSATAGARVRVLSGFQGGPPFIACGVSLAVYPIASPASSTVTHDILDTSTTPPGVKEEYIGTKYALHGPAIGQANGDCNAGTDFKGNASHSQNGCSALPCDYGYQSGNRAGPTRVRVAGALPGCNLTGDNDNVDDCVVILPLANGAGAAASTLNAVTWAAFYLNKEGANEHSGVLIGAIFTQGDASDWSAGQSGPLVLALTE